MVGHNTQKKSNHLASGIRQNRKVSFHLEISTAHLFSGTVARIAEIHRSDRSADGRGLGEAPGYATHQVVPPP